MKLFISGLSIIVILLFSCAMTIPFDVTTSPETMEIPSTMGGYIEKVCESTTETRKIDVNITQLTLNYKITNNSSNTVDIKMYISLDKVVDGLIGNAVEIISVSIPANGTITGSVSPSILATAVKQDKFIIGLKNYSLYPSQNAATMIYTIHAVGTFSL